MIVISRKENTINVIAKRKIKTYINTARKVNCKEETDINQIFQEFSDSENEEVHFEALKKMRNLIDDKLYDDFSRFDILPKVVKCLKCEESEVQYAAAYVLANIAGGKKYKIEKLLESCTENDLVSLLESSNMNVRHHILRVLNNISANFLLTYSLRIFKTINSIINDNIDPSVTLEIISVLLYNMTSGNTISPSDLLEMIPILNYLVKFNDKIITSFVSKTILNLFKVEYHEYFWKSFINTDLPPWIVILLYHNDNKIQGTALLTIENFVSIEMFTNIFLSENMLAYFPSLYKYNKNDLICELATRVVLKIMEKNASQKQRVIDAGLLPLIVENISKGTNKVQLNAILVVNRMFHNSTPSQVAFTIACDPIPGLCMLLKCGNKVTIEAVILCLYDIINTCEDKKYIAFKIEECGVLNLIHELEEGMTIDYDSRKRLRSILEVFKDTEHGYY